MIFKASVSLSPWYGGFIMLRSGQIHSEEKTLRFKVSDKMRILSCLIFIYSGHRKSKKSMPAEHEKSFFIAIRYLKALHV